jgi:RNase P/RNase MRP subunit p29
MQKILGFGVPAFKIKGLDEINKIGQMADVFAKLNKVNGIFNIPNSTKSHNGLTGIQNIIDSIADSKSNISSSAMDAVIKQSKMMELALGGTNRFDISKIIPPLSKINDNILKELSYVKGIQENVSKYLDVYNHQLNISELLANNFASLIPVQKTTWASFTAENFIENKRLTAFDIASGATFYNTVLKFQGDEQKMSVAYNEAMEALGNEEVMEELRGFQATVMENEKLWDGKFFAEWFLNKILIKKFGLNKNVAKLIISIAFLIFFSPMLSELGKEPFEEIKHSFKSSEDLELKGESFIKYIKKKEDISDWVIKKTSIYLRNAVKSKRIGIIKKGTTLLILNSKEGWCYVQGRVLISASNNRKNRKKYKTTKAPQIIKETVRGWIKSENLDMYND